MSFSRNSSCIGCGHPRQPLVRPVPLITPVGGPSLRMNSSPRFVTQSSVPAPLSSPVATTTPVTLHGLPVSRTPMSPRSPFNATKPPPPSYPLLTPSGRALATGGRVQNISSNPLLPCVMYWPDNEPYPEQGQIRPQGPTGTQVRP
jgi:hypothetical protein